MRYALSATARLDSKHAGLEIAEGLVREVTAQNIFGFNRVVGTSFETIWNNGGLYSYPSTAANLNVASSSASDTMNVIIVGLDENYDPLSEIVTLDGTNTVTTDNEFLRVNSATILSGSNVGNITIADNGTTVGYIEATIGTTQACNFTVPRNHALYIFRIDLTSGTVNGNKYIIYRNRLNFENGRVLRVAEATFQINQQSFDRQIPFRIEEKTDFQFEAKSSSSDNEVSIFIEAVLVKEALA